MMFKAPVLKDAAPYNGALTFPLCKYGFHRDHNMQPFLIQRNKINNVLFFQVILPLYLRSRWLLSYQFLTVSLRSYFLWGWFLFIYFFIVPWTFHLRTIKTIILAGNFKLHTLYLSPLECYLIIMLCIKTLISFIYMTMVFIDILDPCLTFVVRKWYIHNIYEPPKGSVDFWPTCQVWWLVYLYATRKSHLQKSKAANLISALLSVGDGMDMLVAVPSLCPSVHWWRGVSYSLKSHYVIKSFKTSPR